MSASVPDLTSALQHAESGNPREAERICREILKHNPYHSEACHLLGVLVLQSGQPQLAVEWFRRAILGSPKVPLLHFNLGVAQQELGDLAAAEASYRQALRLDPDYAAAHGNLGSVLLAQGKIDAALASLEESIRLQQDNCHAHQCRGEALLARGMLEEAQFHLQEAVRLGPGSFQAHNNLGIVHLRQKQYAQALVCFREAVRLQPAYADAHDNLGIVLREQGALDEAVHHFRQALSLSPNRAAIHHRLARVLEQQDKLGEAVDHLGLATRLQPENAQYHNDLGNVLIFQRAFEEALQAYREAIRLNPNEAVFYSNLGNTFTMLGELAEAEASCRQALELRSDLADVHHNLAVVLRAQGRREEAVASLNQALELEPEHSGARLCRAFWWLAEGNFAQGWPDYEWRWKKRRPAQPAFKEPLWDGGPLEGRTILLQAEQGLGDTIQFIRYAPLVKQFGGTVIVECQKPLVRLLSRCRGIDQLVPAGSPLPPFDVRCPLMSLPGILGTTLATIPADVPYLFADPELVEQWRRELSGYRGLKIGIAWQGSRTFLGDRLRSIPLAHFAPLAQSEGVHLFSLQKGEGSEQVPEVAGLFHVIDLTGRLDEASGPFMDTAAVMMNLDLIITSDTAVAHLAGALGVPVWVALGIAADFRFLLDRSDSPWYPTMRLFRQTRLQDWDDVFKRIAAQLPRKEAATPAPAALGRLWTQAVEAFQAGRVQQAEAVCQLILQTEPTHALALNLLGVLTQQTGRPREALGYLRRALALNPTNAQGCYNLGVAQQACGQLDEAVASYEQVLRLAPDHAEAHNNLGMILGQQGNIAEAVPHYQQALRLQPENAMAHHNLGLAAFHQGQLEEALVHLREAHRLQPDSANICHDLGFVLSGLGQADEGLAKYEAALQLAPRHAEAHYCRALALLLKGDFRQGWPELEWRWKTQLTRGHPYRQPLWDGSTLFGKSILLHAEQGLGDTLQFIRYAALVKQSGGTVIVECQKRLVPLLSGCRGIIDQVVAATGPLPPFEVQAPLLSLPGIVGTTLATIPATVPYLVADPALVERWRQELNAVSGFKIGIAWQGNSTYVLDRGRSLPLRCFAPLARVKGVRLISLQKGEGSEQVPEVAAQFQVIDLAERLDEASGAFMDTAAVMMSLDLVITSDTAVAHLAGALGVPVWVALSAAPDWRWLLDREDSPWYPSMRLFRQSRLGQWDEVFEQMAGALRKRLGLPARAKPLRAAVSAGELIDKITILDIKTQRLTDPAQLGNVRAELAALTSERDRAIEPSNELASLTTQLRAVNEQLWEIEDALRLCERDQVFGDRFVELARSVYHHNDRRSALKRQINDLLGSELIEEKAYVDYHKPGGPS